MVTGWSNFSVPQKRTSLHAGKKEWKGWSKQSFWGDENDMIQKADG